MLRLLHVNFAFLTRHLGYVVAVAFFSAGIGGGLSIAIILNAWPFLSVNFTPEFVFFIKLSFVVPWLKSFILFGGLKRLGHLGFGKVVKTANSGIVADPVLRVRDDLSSAEYKKLLYALNRIPRHMFRNSVFDIVSLIIVLLPLAHFTQHLDMRITLWILLAGTLGLVSYGGLGFVLGEAVSGPMRKECKRILHGRKVAHLETSGSTMRIKQVMLHGLIVSGLIITNLITYFNTENLLPVLGVSLLVIFGIIFMAQVVFQVLFDSIRDVGDAVSELKDGGEGIVYTASIDQEFTDLAAGINTAAETINDYRQNLEDKVARRTADLQRALDEVAEKDAILQQELDFAADVQRGIIQQNLGSWNGINFAATYVPRGKVSGDYYDIFRSQNSAFVLLADVSGHGIPAAFITMAAKETFTATVEPEKKPSQIFAKVNLDLGNRVKTQDYLTAFMLKIDNENRVTYSNAAHQPAVHYKAASGEFELLDTQGFFLGAMDEHSSSYENKTLDLQPGDRIFLYTDGILDSTDDEDKPFGHERFMKALKSQEGVLDNVHMRVIGDLNEFLGMRNIRDDISMLSIELTPDWADFKTMFEAGIAAKEAKNHKKAFENFLRAYKLIATYPKLIVHLIETSFALKEYEQSANFAEEYLHRYSEIEKVLYFAARNYIELGEEEKAKNFVRKFKKMVPYDPRSLELNQELIDRF